MTKRASYREVIPRCQAMTQKKVRCARDATHMQGNKALCTKHAEAARKKILVKGYSPHPEEFVTKG
jgi:hypothetical protein